MSKSKREMERLEFRFEGEEYEGIITRLILLEKRLPGSTHRDEDRLLERYVRDRAFEGDPRAEAIVPLFDLEKRRRWYA